MKRTGAASVAALVLADSLTFKSHAQAAACSCKPHKGHCDYVTKLEVEFTSIDVPTIPVENGEHLEMQGKMFRGTMKVYVTCCQGQTGEGHTKVHTFAVHSGGYRDTTSNYPDDPDVDTVIPPGDYEPETKVDGGSIPGFETKCPNRTQIEIHGPKMVKRPRADDPDTPNVDESTIIDDKTTPNVDESAQPDDPNTPEDESKKRKHEGRSAGCIIITDTTDNAAVWTKFRNLMQNHKSGCPHYKAKVPLNVKYGPNAQPNFTP